MKWLTTLFGNGQRWETAVTALGTTQELPYRHVAELLWWYFLNNGLYEELRRLGYFLEEESLKGVRNPAQRVVKFYADTIWPGPLDKALPLDLESNGQIEQAIYNLWKWSNWQKNKQTAVRWAAIVGEYAIKVQTKGQRVYLKLMQARYIADDLRFDEMGNVIYLRMDIPQSRKVGRGREFYTYTEVWSKATQTARIWEHTKGENAELEELGAPKETVPFSQLGIDFVPFVICRHMDLGDGERGVGSYLLQLDKIDEANRLATRLHQLMFRHNQPLWALSANGVDATGRPLPPPRIDTNELSGEVIELGGERLVRLPGVASLESMVPNLHYDDHLQVLTNHLTELEKDLPELKYFEVMDSSKELSGRAIRMMLRPALTSAYEVRGNAEEALIRAQQMALTIGQNIGADGFANIGSYEDGDLEHGFVERPLIPADQLEIAETIKAEVDTGIPLRTALRRAGWSEEEIQQMEEDAQAQREAEQASLANAMLEAQNQFDAGQNGRLE